MGPGSADGMVLLPLARSFSIDPKAREREKRDEILRRIVHKHAQHLQFRNDQQVCPASPPDATNDARAHTHAGLEPGLVSNAVLNRSPMPFAAAHACAKHRAGDH